MHDETVVVRENKKVNGSYYKLTFRSLKLARMAKPGQFLNVRIQDGFIPFLRRPFSYYRVAGDRVEVLYEILGQGTRLLAGKRPGDCLQVLGPLGKPFRRNVGKRKKILVGGGCGVPPLVFLAEKWGADYLLIGARSVNEVLHGRELRQVKAKVLYATDNGSFGRKGVVTALLEELAAAIPPEKIYLQTCGPRAMMCRVMEIARDYHIEGEASLDESMACGIGACLGCVVKTKEGYVPSCTHGPVFRFDQVEGMIARRTQGCSGKAAS